MRLNIFQTTPPDREAAAVLFFKAINVGGIRACKNSTLIPATYITPCSRRGMGDSIWLYILPHYILL